MKRISIFAILVAVILAACSPTSSVDITGGWELVSYGDPASLTPAAPGIDTSIEFKSDGTLAGNVGCNGFGGEYKLSGSAIEFGQIISTLMFCEGPVGEQEAVTLSVFSDTASFTLDGDRLMITSSDGSAAIVLARN